MRAIFAPLARSEVSRPGRAAVAGGGEVPRAQRHERGLHGFVGIPGFMGEPREDTLGGGRGTAATWYAEVVLRASASHARYPGIGDSVTKCWSWQKREVAAKPLDDLIDERGAEVDSHEPGLAARDRIEHRGVGVIGVEVGHRARRAAEPGRTACRWSARSRRTRAARRASTDGRTRTPAVGVEAVLSNRPTVDRVHRFVLDQLLEERGGHRPGDPPQLEQADVEEQRELGPEFVADFSEPRWRPPG